MPTLKNGDEYEIARQKIEYFYQHFAVDNDNNPNWFYYWKEGGVLPILKDDNVKFEYMYRMVAYSKGQKIVIGPRSIDPEYQQFPAEGNFIFFNDYNPRAYYHYVSTPSTVLEALCYTVAHEKLHTIINKHSKGKKDEDEKHLLTKKTMGDNIADEYEVSSRNARVYSKYDWKGGNSSIKKKMFGILSCEGKRDTWNVCATLGEQYRRIGDNEMRVRMREVEEGEKLILTFRKDLNWSDYVGKPDYNAMSNYGN